MKGLLALTCLFTMLASTPATATANHVLSSTCPSFSAPAMNAQNVSENPTFWGGDPVVFFGEDPAGDGTDACSVEDCKVCNYNGLMCTPTPTGCNCDYWDQ